MSSYLKEVNILWPVEKNAIDLRTSLPLGTYTVGINERRGWFLKEITDFNIKHKIFGKAARQAERIINTFNDRSATTGVLLNGEKGSGKTMLAKLISQLAAKQGMSTLVINSSFSGDSFNTFIQSIAEPCVIIFDEFEKTFDDKEQQAILTLLDGVFPTKKLFILTVNDKYRINTHMRNRPGRLYYSIDFSGLDETFIREYCEEMLNDKQHIPQICRLTTLFSAFNFDMLKALVEEMNRYNETPKQAMEMLNAKPLDAGKSMHDVEVIFDGLPVAKANFRPARISGNPVAMEDINFVITVPDGTDDEEEVYFEIGPNHLKKIDLEAGQFTYVIQEDDGNRFATFIITREPYTAAAYSYMDAF